MGHYQILLVFMPMTMNEQRMMMFDLDAQFPFWPLARFVSVRKSEETRVVLNVRLES